MSSDSHVIELDDVAATLAAEQSSQIKSISSLPPPPPSKNNEAFIEFLTLVGISLEAYEALPVVERGTLATQYLTSREAQRQDSNGFSSDSDRSLTDELSRSRSG